MRGPSPIYVLCHEHVVHANDVDLVNALRLELVVFFDVSRYLRMTRGCEGSRHANLFRLCIFNRRSTKEIVSLHIITRTQKCLSRKRKVKRDGGGTCTEPKSAYCTHKYVFARGRERDWRGGVRLLDSFF